MRSILLAAALLAMSVASASAQEENSVHVAVFPEPSMLMQGLNQNGPTNMIAGNIYESLLRFDHKLGPQASLAEAWEVSQDGKVYTFHLRKNAQWHDGKPFSADDVVFSLDTFLREVHPRWRPIVTAHVERIEKKDDNTVVISLKHPFGPLLLAMEVASAPIVPRHLYEGTDYRTNPANATPVGTGPFKFEEWKKGSFIHLARNKNYYLAGKPAIADIYYEFIPDAAARAVAYQTGKLDVLTGGSVDIYDVKRLSELPGTCITTEGWELSSPLAWLQVNHRNGILGNKLFRQGLMFAIDRDFGRDVVWDGFGKVPTGPISSTTRFYSNEVPAYAFDPEKAKALIKESGYTGEVIRLLGLPYGETWSRWAEAIKQNLADVGVNVDIESTDVAGWVSKVGGWDFDMTFNFVYQLGDPAIGVSRSYVTSNIAKGNPFANVGGYSNPDADKLFADAAVAPTDSERQALYTQVQKTLVEDLPNLWLLELQYPTIYRCNIKDLVTTAIGVNDGFRDARKE